MLLFPPSFSGNEANQSFQDSCVTKIIFLLLYSREVGRAGWQLEGIVQHSVKLSEQNSKVSKTQIKALRKFKTKTQFPSNLSSSAPAYSLQHICLIHGRCRDCEMSGRPTILIVDAAQSCLNVELFEWRYLSSKTNKGGRNNEG
jgi:hypothetical protein